MPVSTGVENHAWVAFCPVVATEDQLDYSGVSQDAHDPDSLYCLQSKPSVAVCHFPCVYPHASALVQDTRLMKSAGTSSISEALRSVVVAIFGLVLMFITSVLLTGLTLAILPLLLLSFRWFAIVNKKYTTEQLTASAEASTVAEECFGSIRTVSSPASPVCWTLSACRDEIACNISTESWQCGQLQCMPGMYRVSKHMHVAFADCS